MTSATSTRTEDFTAVLTLPASPDAVSALFTSAAETSSRGPVGEGSTGGGALPSTSARRSCGSAKGSTRAGA